MHEREDGMHPAAQIHERCGAQDRGQAAELSPPLSFPCSCVEAVDIHCQT